MVTDPERLVPSAPTGPDRPPRPATPGPSPIVMSRGHPQALLHEKHTGAGDEVVRSHGSQWNPLALYGMNAGTRCAGPPSRRIAPARPFVKSRPSPGMASIRRLYWPNWPVVTTSPALKS